MSQSSLNGVRRPGRASDVRTYGHRHAGRSQSIVPENKAAQSEQQSVTVGEVVGYLSYRKRQTGQTGSAPPATHTHTHTHTHTKVQPNLPLKFASLMLREKHPA
jgi:hypothetical protein